MKLFNNEQNFCYFNYKLLFKKTRNEQNSILKKILVTRRGTGYLDVVIGLFSLLMVLSFAMKFLPVFAVKQQLDTFAAELVREAEVTGSTSVETRIGELQEQTGLTPQIEWDCEYFSGKKVQLNETIAVTVTETVDIGFFVFGSFPIELQARAGGRSEVYFK